MLTARIVPAGDSTLIVELEARIDPAVNARVVAIAATIAAEALPGIRDVVPTYRSVAISFDPLRTDLHALEALVARAVDSPRVKRARARKPIEIPMCYGGACGPDLAAVAAHAGCSEAEVVRLHSERTYRVYMLGFVPGFAYLGEVDPRLAMPRHEKPRPRVPARSVGIAGRQTGIYPAETPGGWQLIGRTPVKPFDPARRRPALFAAGDAVKFTPITIDEYERLCRGEGDGCEPVARCDRNGARTHCDQD
jgi:KipI family sensor histidine kinase inhibitor